MFLLYSVANSTYSVKYHLNWRTLPPCKASTSQETCTYVHILGVGDRADADEEEGSPEELVARPSRPAEVVGRVAGEYTRGVRGGAVGPTVMFVPRLDG